MKMQHNSSDIDLIELFLFLKTKIASIILFVIFSLILSFTFLFITKDKVAEILGTNRTYLSRIINEQSKLSFTHYVNRFRIEEAIRLLSDPNNETPLKAISTELGFNSISTFYNLFQSSVGMTPSQYRNKVMELQKEQ